VIRGLEGWLELQNMWKFIALLLLDTRQLSIIGLQIEELLFPESSTSGATDLNDRYIFRA
jgi:hypothetical protein